MVRVRGNSIMHARVSGQTRLQLLFVLRPSHFGSKLDLDGDLGCALALLRSNYGQRILLLLEQDGLTRRKLRVEDIQTLLSRRGQVRHQYWLTGCSVTRR